MAKSERRYGTVPPARRRLVGAACAVVGLAAVAAGLVLNWATDSPVVWGWLVVAAGFVVGLYAVYLWVRLSD